MRIISLIPSATEIVCALGYKDQLVGRSHECDFPPGVEKLPVCCEPKFNPHEGTSMDIHKHVTDIVRESLSVYRVDTDKLKELKPDFIITQAQCEVCAVSLNDVKKAVSDWVDSKPQIVSLEPMLLNDLWLGIQQVAEALGNPHKGEELVQLYRSRVADISQVARNIKSKPSIACIEWIDPLMSAGNWVPEFIELLGGINCFGEAGKHSPRMLWEDLKAKNPDIMIGMPCGWSIERCAQEMPTLSKKPGWKEMKAVEQNRVYLTDGHQFFNRPGPRLIESIEIMAEMMYPDVMDYGHKGKHWKHYQ